MSVLITFEGGDGCGKSTQAALLERQLSEEGYDVLLLQEPGSTALGAYLRDWLKSESYASDSLNPVAELLLFIAARAQLVSEIIKPALDKANTVVICDRYIDSTTAYQGYGRELGVEVVEPVNATAIEGIFPDLTFLIDLPPEAALARVNTTIVSDKSDDQVGTGSTDDRHGMQRFEAESLSFHQRVYQGYLDLAEQNPKRWRVVKGDRPVLPIGDEIRQLAGEVLSSITPYSETTKNKEELFRRTDCNDGSSSSQPSLF